MNDSDKIIASTVVTAHLSFSLGTFKIRLQRSQIYINNLVVNRNWRLILESKI